MVTDELSSFLNLNFDQIAMAINAGSIDLPGGLLSSKSGDLLIRTVGQSYNANEYENIVIKGQPDGGQLLLKDIATITDGFIDVERYYRWDGVQAMFISVNLVGDQDVLLAAEQLRAYVKQKQAEMPANVTIGTIKPDIYRPVLICFIEILLSEWF